MAVRRYPDPVAAFDQLKNDLGAYGRLAGSGRTLDGQVRAIEMRCKQHGDVSRTFACLNERRSFDHTLDARRLQAKEITHCPELPGTTKAVIHDVLAKPEKSIALIVGRDGACRNERGRVRHFGLLAATQFDPTGNAVKVVDGSGGLHPPRVVWFVPNCDLVLLGRVEVVAEDV